MSTAFSAEPEDLISLQKLFISRKPRPAVLFVSLISGLVMTMAVSPAPTLAVEEHGAVKLQYEHAVEDVNNEHYDKAYSRFRKIANQGHVHAQHISGLMCEKGCGTEPNLRKAVSYYRKAANKNFPDSQSKLGHMYLQGNAVIKQDFGKAKIWLEKAAHNDVPEAQHSLGMMYANGTGVKQDFVQAGIWLRKAASNGVKEAEEAVAKLPPIPLPGGSTPAGNILGAPGAAYATGLQSVKQSWSGYGDVVHVLNNINNR